MKPEEESSGSKGKQHLKLMMVRKVMDSTFSKYATTFDYQEIIGDT